MNILISGDFYISDDFQNKDLIDQSVIDLFHQADYRITNLEAPLTVDEPKNKILKTGPHLRMSAKAALPFLKQLKVDCVTLANNHILDYGAKGLLDTFDALNYNNIKYVGAGKTLKEASQTFTLEKDGLRIAILNFCENEWSIAEEDSPGANPLDLIDNVNQIKAATNTHDKVICIIHGGHEYYHLPSPRIKKQYRFYVDNGADAIVGHHTHCYSGYEVYKNAPIFYSLGNFVFTKEINNPLWFEGLLIQFIVEKNKQIEWEVLPVKQNKKTYFVQTLKDTEKEDVLNRVEKISTLLNNPILLEKAFIAFSEKKENSYLNTLSPVSVIPFKIIRKGFTRLGLSIKLINQRQLATILNITRCESHSDLFIGALKNRLKNKKSI